MTNDERDALIKKAAEAMVEYDNPGVYERGDVIVDWDDYVGAAEAALAVFEEAHTLTECLDCGRTDGGCDRIMDTPTDDEREALAEMIHLWDTSENVGASKWGDLTEKQRDVWREGADFLYAAGFRRPVQAEPNDAQLADIESRVYDAHRGQVAGMAKEMVRAGWHAALKEGENR